MTIKHLSATQEAEITSVALNFFGEGDNITLIDRRTPFDALAEKEDGKDEEHEIRTEAISALLSFLFAPATNRNGPPTPLQVLERLYLLVYSVRPALVEGWSLDKISRLFSSSRQTFSKRLLKQNEKLGIRSRNQKTDHAVSIYREGTTKWHAERKERERREKRKKYMKEWRAKNSAEVKEYQKEYREENKERLNKSRRKRREKGKE